MMVYPREPTRHGRWTIEYNFLGDVKVIAESNNLGYSLSLKEIEAVLLASEYIFNLSNKSVTINTGLTTAVLKALINAMKKRCSGFPVDSEIEEMTIETAEEMLNTIEKSLKGGK